MQKAAALLVLLAACAPKTSMPPPRVAPQPEAAAPVTPADPLRAQELVTRARAILREQGESGAPSALETLTEALAADPTSKDALWEIGWTHQLLARYDDAIAAWDRLRVMQPDYPELPRNYPVLLMRRDQARVLAQLPEPGALPPPEEEPREGPSITITAVGDIQMGRAWPDEDLPPEDGLVLFANVRDILARAELMFGNAETVLADTGESTKCGNKKSKSCYAFRVPARFAHTLKAVGFDVVSAANNHTGDFGPEGRAATIAALDAAGLKHSGPVGDVASWEQNGLRVGLVAFATGTDMYRVQDIETARKVVADVDRAHDIVIVSFHAGAEGAKAVHVPKAREIFYGEDRGDVHAFSHAMIDAGADLVLGHGPHVLRAMEIYRGRFIAYSLGNFCAYKGFNLSGPTGTSGILEVTLAPNGVATRAKLHPLVIDQPGIPRPDASGTAIKAVRELSLQDLGTSVLDEKGEYVRPSIPGPVAGP